MSASQGSILSSFDPMDNEAVENLIKDDEQLRGCGFPQQLLIALRSVGYRTVQILQLPSSTELVAFRRDSQRILVRPEEPWCSPISSSIPLT